MAGRIHRLVHWVGFAGIALLVVMSVAGAFFGAVSAKEIFNSVPMVVYWLAMVCFLACYLLNPRTLRNPALAAVHLGALLILIGAMLGSDRAHRLAGRLAGRSIPVGGYLMLAEGEQTNRLVDQQGQVIGDLPFNVRLERFWTEYHWSSDGRWELYAVPPADLVDERAINAAPRRIDWAVGQTVAIGGTDAAITVLQYLHQAEPLYDDAGMIVGAAASLESGWPAMEASLDHAGEKITGWFIVRDGKPVRLALPGPTADIQIPPAEQSVELFLVPPTPLPRQHYSDVTILAGDQPAIRKTISINNPMRNDGYYIYQHTFDSSGCRDVSVLMVRSGRGRMLVFFGSAVMLAGLVGRLWFASARLGLRAGRSEGPAPAEKNT